MLLQKWNFEVKMDFYRIFWGFGILKCVLQLKPCIFSLYTENPGVNKMYEK